MASHPQQPRTKGLVIGIAGPLGSGKTSVGHYLSSKEGFQYLRYSQVLADWFDNETTGKARLQEIGWGVMAGGKQSELNRRLISQVSPEGDVAIDGLRHPIDYELLKQRFSSSFHLVYIDSPVEERWRRLEGRGRYTSRDIFDAATAHPVEQQIAGLSVKADLVIVNKGPLEQLYAAIDGAVRDFRREVRT